MVCGLLLGLLVTGAPGRFFAEAGDAPEVRLRSVRDREGGVEVQAEVLEELRQLGGQGKDVSAELIEFIADGDQSLELRCRGVLVLRDVGFEDREWAASLFGVLQDPGTEEELRRTILIAHGDRHDFASVLVPSLLSITGEKSASVMLRRQALFILRDHLASEDVIEALTRLLVDEAESLEIRTMVVELLNVPAMLPAETLEALGAMALKGNEVLALRSRAIEALAARGQDAAPSLPSLGNMVVDSEAPLPLRLRAVRALGQIGASGASAGGLLEVLLRVSEPVELRRELAKVIAEWEVAERRADWVTVLKQDEHPVEVRRLAAGTLARADDVGPEVIALSVGLMGDASEDVAVRLAAAEVLGIHVADAEDVRGTLEEILGDPGQPRELRERACTLLAQTARSWLEAVGELTWESLGQRIQAAADARRLMEGVGLDTTQAQQSLQEIRRVQEVLLAERRSRWLERGADWARRHRGLAVGILCLGLFGLVATGLVGTWTVLSRRAPMTLWKLDQRMRRYDGRLPAWLGGKIGPRHLLFLNSRRRDLRVRKAWQRTIRPLVRARFKRLRAELGADPYVSVPVQSDGELREGELGVAPGRLFERARDGVVIGGEAGTGKTCLALELAWRWLAERGDGLEEAFPLPIWMEDRSGTRGCSFDWSAEVRGVLNSWLPVGLVPTRETVEALLRDGCLVPFVDGASEWPVEDGFWMDLQRGGHDGMSFFLTTRHPEPWAGRVGVLCSLPRLASHEASGFLQTFLSRVRGNRALSVSDVLKTCRQWEIMTDGRAVPVQVVRWYAELVVSEMVPETLVEIGELHVQRLHEASGRLPLTGTELVQTLGAIAWTELQRGGCGRGLTMDEMKGAGVNAVELAGWVEHLERGLGLLERPRGEETPRFRHWWLKVYLAAGHLIRRHGQDGDAWRRFFREGQVGGCEARALDEAILDGTLWMSDPLASPPIPAWVCDRLGERIGLEPARRERRLAAARAREMATQILTAEHPDRAEVIQELGKMGAAAAAVVPMLSAGLSDAGQDLEVRYGALIALGLLGRTSLAATATLEAVSANREEQLFLRIKALEVLVGMSGEKESTVRTLVDRLRDAREPTLLRVRAGELISGINHAGCDAGALLDGIEDDAVPGLRELIDRLRGRQQQEVVNRL